MPTTCCDVNCGSRGDRDRVNFYKIPSELHFAHRVYLNELSERRRQKWIHANRREDLTEVKLKYTRVCSKHFVSGEEIIGYRLIFIMSDYNNIVGKPSESNDENSPDWFPSLAMVYGNDELVRKKAHITSAREGRARRRRKQMEIPDEIENVESSESQTNENDEHCQTNITAEDFTQDYTESRDVL
ncbi:hypothetical protein JTB14_028667 [Gonioctena quinquepunctata]|nr:hypothetical protein JTB14_028667 [Gonioctena quinquepunctata]